MLSSARRLGAPSLLWPHLGPPTRSPCSPFPAAYAKADHRFVRQRGQGGRPARPLTLQATSQQRPDVESWEAPCTEWELPEADSADEDDDLFPQQDGGAPEFLLQNVLAVALLTLLGLSLGNILWKLIFVAGALVSAAFRYTVVAALIIVLFAIFT